MLRTSLAVLAALLLVGLLSLLIVESRAVKEDYYAAHADRMRAIESSRNDLTAVTESTQAAFDQGRQISTSTYLSLARLDESNTVLQSPEDQLQTSEAVEAQLLAYKAGLHIFVRNAQAFAERQDAFSEALRTMQEESPLVVKDLRRFNLRLQSQNTFSLAIDIIEYATGVGRISSDQLIARIEALRDDSAVTSRAPGAVDTFATAALEVIEQRTAAAGALQKIAGSRIADTLWTLSDEILNDNRRTVSRAEMARLLLSVCTVLLLLGTGYAMFRLQASYRDLNKSNRDLESMNNSLEGRVADRTEKLSEAYEDLKESQVQLVQAEKMSSLGELVAGISHEINTPLWYLINNATVLQERLEVLSDFCAIAENMIEAVKAREGIKETVGRGLIDMRTMLKDGMRDDIDESRDLIQDSIEGLEELTELAQSLKDFSRLDRAQRGDFDVNDGLDKALLIAKNRLKNKASIHKHYGDLPTIHCSPSQINQIFLNLLTNAADAIEDRGEIVIQTAADDQRVRISISDTGSGIPDELLSKIRDPFFTTKEVGKGTGLGLSIVDQIITSHGGELLIESEPGKGTTVTIVLPLIASMSVEDALSQENEDGDADAANDPHVEESLPEAANEETEDDAPERASV
ncbi:MAG: sensor histidine kinase [Woeseiaceae bacterium]